MRKWILRILTALFAAVFLVSGFFVARYYIESGTQQGQFQELAVMVDEKSSRPTQPSDAEDPEVTVPTQPQMVEVLNTKTGETFLALPEYAQLYLINPDIVGWMRIEGADVNLPVMQTPDRTDYYLHRNFSKEYSSLGCLYAREQCDVFAPSDNITIYGHRMNDGSMFGNLSRYQSKEHFEKYPTFTFDTLDEYHTYQILAVFTTTSSVGQGFSYHLFVNADSAEEFDAYIATCKELSLYDTGVTAAYGDKLITLSTCEYSQVNGRLVIVAKRID